MSLQQYMPIEIGKIYFIGIGGIGMSGIAEILFDLGYDVVGSDMGQSPNTKRLTDKGILVHIGHHGDHILDSDRPAVIVTSSAVKSDNPELQAAKQLQIPVIQRAEMLAELMRLKWSIAIGGTHGKTTTTSLFAHLLHVAGLDPTVINGGVINSWNSNARLGQGDWIVAEADESDGSFLKLPSTIAVITNIDPEHMEHYGTFDHLKAAFKQFVQRIPFYGFALICADHDETKSLIGSIDDRRIISYGFSPQALLRATNVETGLDGMYFDILWRGNSTGDVSIEKLHLSMFGHHNVQNALAAIGAALEIGVSEELIRSALGSFKGVKRRFTTVANINGIQIIDDYAHHPIEIRAVLSTSRSICRGKIIAIVQPHRYSRLYDLFDDFCGCFHDADQVYVSEVHAAGETAIDNIDAQALVDGTRRQGHLNVNYLGDPNQLAEILKDSITSGDMIIYLGAGSITNWANAMPDQLEQAIAGSHTKTHTETHIVT